MIIIHEKGRIRQPKNIFLKKSSDPPKAGDIIRGHDVPSRKIRLKLLAEETARSELHAYGVAFSMNRSIVEKNNFSNNPKDYKNRFNGNEWPNNISIYCNEQNDGHMFFTREGDDFYLDLVKL
jgi:hypothetical protein